MSKYRKGDMVQVVDGGYFPDCEEHFVPGKYYYVFNATDAYVKLSDRKGRTHRVSFGNLIKLEEPDYDGILQSVIKMNTTVLENIAQMKALRKELEANARRNTLH